MTRARQLGQSTKQRSYQDRRAASSRFGQYIVVFTLLFSIYQVTTTFFIKSYYNPTHGMEPTLPIGARILASPLLYGPTLWGGYRMASKVEPKRGDIFLIQSIGSNKISVIANILRPFTSFFTFQYFTPHGQKGKLQMPDLIMKRIIALPQDTIKMENSVIFVRPAGEIYFTSEFEYSSSWYEIKHLETKDELNSDHPFTNSFSEITLSEDEFFVIGDNRTLTNDSRSFGYVSSNDIRAKVIGHYWPIRKRATKQQ